MPPAAYDGRPRNQAGGVELCDGSRPGEVTTFGRGYKKEEIEKKHTTGRREKGSYLGFSRPSDYSRTVCENLYS